MKKWMKAVKEKSMYTMVMTKSALRNRRGEGFIDTAVKILIGVVIGALILGGLYVLFSTTILPTLNQRIIDMFNYKR
ncbi:DUF6133 family protein [Paenibacillus sp. FSL R10-2782]|uniref:DUF6133 family protein n=1 Tax=Paenibacillus sp. FSL R10-2782 TaxID=2954661 RepID=UPI0031595049